MASSPFYKYPLSLSASSPFTSIFQGTLQRPQNNPTVGRDDDPQ